MADITGIDEFSLRELTVSGANHGLKLGIDGDELVISADASNNVTFDVAGDIILDAGGNVGIGTTNPILKTQIHGTHGAPTASGTPTAGILRLSQTSGTLIMDMGTLANGSSNGGWIQSYVNNNAGSPQKLFLNPTGGNVGIGETNPTYKLAVNGTLGCIGFTDLSSDDRIKYNEENINSVSALSIINQLQPQKYEKIIEIPQDASGTWIPTDTDWPNVKDNYVWALEAGLIAQDIQNISELSFAVSGTEVNSEGKQKPLALSYNNIFVYHIAATKELSSQLDSEKAKTATLETDLTAEKAKTATLETDLTAEKAKTATLETNVSTLETQMADLLSRVTALENP